MIKSDVCTEISPFDLAKNSTIGTGGYAELAYAPKTQDELLRVIQKLEQTQTKYCIVGNMSNVLPADGKSKRTFVLTKKVNAITDNYFEAGVSVGRFLAYCKDRGLSGGEFLEGIPCTLGGALYMNAGVAGAYMNKIIQSVRVYHNGKVQTLTNAECGYEYKTSVFMQGGFVILGATLALRQADEITIAQQRAYYKERRKGLPKGKSMGCVFKNPENLVAGKLIEGAGLKGLRVGGAHVSNIHANFIINDLGATSAQVRSLIEIVKNAVFAQYKIRLKEEIIYLE